MGELIRADALFRRRDAESTDVLHRAIDAACPTARGRAAVLAALDRMAADLGERSFVLGSVTFGATADEAAAAWREMLLAIARRHA